MENQQYKYSDFCQMCSAHIAQRVVSYNRYEPMRNSCDRHTMGCVHHTQCVCLTCLAMIYKKRGEYCDIKILS